MTAPFAFTKLGFASTPVGWPTLVEIHLAIGELKIDELDDNATAFDAAESWLKTTWQAQREQQAFKEWQTLGVRLAEARTAAKQADREAAALRRAADVALSQVDDPRPAEDLAVQAESVATTRQRQIERLEELLVTGRKRAEQACAAGMQAARSAALRAADKETQAAEQVLRSILETPGVSSAITAVFRARNACRHVKEQAIPTGLPGEPPPLKPEPVPPVPYTSAASFEVLQSVQSARS